MNIQIIDPLTYPGYDEMVLASGGSLFHTSYWARVLHDCYGYRPCYLIKIHDGKIDVLVPLMEIRSFLTGRRGVSLPFTDYCEPMVSDTNNWQDVLVFVKSYGAQKKWKNWELRGGEQWMNQVHFSSSYYRHVLKLSTDVDTLYSQLKSSTKRNIKKAEREGIIIKRSHSLDAVKAFYRLHCLTRKKHGLPPQPEDFFLLLFDHVISRDLGQVVLAVYQDKPIAAAVYFHFGNEAIYKFGASDGSYLHLRPNDLLMWEALQGYCRTGYALFCFGRTEPENEGLRQFKKGWGAEENIVRYYKYDFNRKEFESKQSTGSTLSAMIFKKMPISLLKAIGKALYRHVG